MTTLLDRITDPARWRRLAESRLEVYRRNRRDDALDRLLASLGPVRFAAGEATVIGEGMWSNPNHFLRLRLVIEALAARGAIRLLGILRRRGDRRQRRALERIGFSEFVFLDEDVEIRTEDFLDRAGEMLASVRCHADLLSLPLPDGLPSYTYYDTVLKLAAHPRPPLDHRLWRTTLAATLRNAAIYARELDRRWVSYVIVSHPWKSEWATLTWLALTRAVPTLHLTGFCEGIRIRRLRTKRDYATPVEHLPFALFDRLPGEVRSRLVDWGARDMAERVCGRTTDINARYAFDPLHRIADREAARRQLSGQVERRVGVIYGHVWYDIPHTYGMKNFIDFIDWTRATLAKIRENDDVVWLLKPHPTEPWYGGFYLADLAGDLPPHVKLLPTATDSQTAMTAADLVVTVHGTVAMEAAARGLPVIVADRSFFSDWSIAHVARDRAHYLDLLACASRLAAPDAAAVDRAKACFALALAEPPSEVAALRMSCDSGGSALYAEVLDHYTHDRPGIAREAKRIGAFLDQSEFDSFAAFHLVEAARRIAVANAANAA